MGYGRYKIGLFMGKMEYSLCVTLFLINLGPLSPLPLVTLTQCLACALMNGGLNLKLSFFTTVGRIEPFY